MVRHTLDCATLAFLSVCFNSTDVVELLHDQTPDPVDHVSLRPRGLQPTDWVTAFVFTPPCAQWISLDGFYQSFSCSGQLLIKPHTPFCIIDWFPLRNGSHVTPIVSRLKRSWPTSAVNHKVPLTWKIHSDIFSLPPSLQSFVRGQTISRFHPEDIFCNISRLSITVSTVRQRILLCEHRYGSYNIKNT